MYELKKFLVTLDLSEMDESIVSYSFATASVLQATSITFLHVTPPEQPLSAASGQNGQTVEEACKEQMKALVAKHLVAFDLEVAIYFTVVEGEKVAEVLNCSKETNADLIVVGRKSLSEGSGNLSKRIARRALCSVLSVTENAKPLLNKVLIPLIFPNIPSWPSKRP
jgi:nucleotide-binding universal stress UspA family protein